MALCNFPAGTCIYARSSRSLRENVVTDSVLYFFLLLLLLLQYFEENIYFARLRVTIYQEFLNIIRRKFWKLLPKIQVRTIFREHPEYPTIWIRPSRERPYDTDIGNQRSCSSSVWSNSTIVVVGISPTVNSVFTPPPPHPTQPHADRTARLSQWTSIVLTRLSRPPIILMNVWYKNG